ncbi:MAG: sulfatase-like hydrolase/transferase [Bdellovibrionota bacterium]
MDDLSPAPEAPPPEGGRRFVPFIFTAVALGLVLSLVVGTLIASRQARNLRRQEAVSGDHPNFLVVVFDAFRWESFFKNGHPAPLVELSQSDISYKEAYPPSKDPAASLLALLTGRSPVCGEKAGVPSLPEALKSAGYETAVLVGASDVGDVRRVVPGIDFFAGPGVTGVELSKLLRGKESLLTSTLLTQQAERFVEKNFAKPFFLYVHYADTRIPYGSKESAPRAVNFKGTPEEAEKLRAAMRDRPCGLSPQEQEGARGLYEDALEASGAHLTILRERLSELGILEKTLIVVTGARGEALPQEECAQDAPAAKVPLVVLGPGVAKKTVGPAVSILGLVPTVASLAGAEISSDWSGRDLGGCLTSPAACEEAISNPGGDCAP